MSTLILNIDDSLLKKLTKHAAANQESVNEFTLKAIQDALNMWDDFYELDDKLEQDLEGSRPAPGFFIQA